MSIQRKTTIVKWYSLMKWCAKMIEEPLVKIGRYLSINAPDPLGSRIAELKIDLKDYITASKIRLENSENARLFNDAKSELTSTLSFYSAPKLWHLMIAQATRGLSQDLIAVINAAPVSKFLETSFVEIVKNTVDEAIMHGSMEITLTMTIDDQSDPDNISIMFKDTGTGFSDKFIQQLSTQVGREEYMDGKGSIKKGYKSPVEDLLMGGAGRGLRNLMAMMDHGEEYANFVRYSVNETERPNKRRRKFVRPEGTNMMLGVRPDNQAGAYISLTTSKKPWIEVAQNIDEGEIAEMKTLLYEKFDYNKFRHRFWSDSSDDINPSESNEAQDANKENKI